MKSKLSLAGRGGLYADSMSVGLLPAMSRFLYITAAALLLFTLIAFGMTFAGSAYQPDLPVGGSLWKTTGMFSLLGALLAAFLGVLTRMFEQVGRRNAARGGGRVIEFPGKAGRTAGQEKYSPRDRREQ